jgi:hypothetical protein
MLNAGQEVLRWNGTEDIYQHPPSPKDYLCKLKERYLRKVTPLMREAGADTIRLKAIMGRPIAIENVATLTSNKINKYRDDRLQEIKLNTVGVS